MPSPLDKLKRLTRRQALIAGGVAVGGAATAGVVAIAGRRNNPTDAVIAGIDPQAIEDIGGGFYVANGWVLTSDDVDRIKVRRR